MKSLKYKITAFILLAIGGFSGGIGASSAPDFKVIFLILGIVGGFLSFILFYGIAEILENQVIIISQISDPDSEKTEG